MPRRRPKPPTRRPKRPDGSGSVYYEKARDRWVGLVIIDGKRRKVTGPTKAEVERRVEELVDYAALLDAHGVDFTVADMLNGYLAERAQSRSPATVVSDRYTASHLVELFGRELARDLAPLSIEAGFKVKTRHEISSSYVARMRSQLIHAYDWAIRHQLLTLNPAAVTSSIPGATAVNNPRRILTVTEARALLHVASEHRLGIVVWLGLYLGLRPSEIRGLTVDDVDLDVVVLRVTGQADLAGRRTAPKTRRSRRALRLHPRLADELARHLERRASEMRHAPWVPTDRLVLSEAGTPVDSHNLGRHVARWASKAGITGSVSPYDLRATWAEFSIDDGASLREVAQLAGHADDRTLQRHYLTRVDHVLEGGMRAGGVLT